MLRISKFMGLIFSFCLAFLFNVSLSLAGEGFFENFGQTRLPSKLQAQWDLTVAVYLINKSSGTIKNYGSGLLTAEGTTSDNKTRLYFMTNEHVVAVYKNLSDPENYDLMVSSQSNLGLITGDVLDRSTLIPVNILPFQLSEPLDLAFLIAEFESSATIPKEGKHLIEVNSKVVDGWNYVCFDSEGWIENYVKKVDEKIFLFAFVNTLDRVNAMKASPGLSDLLIQKRYSTGYVLPRFYKVEGYSAIATSNDGVKGMSGGFAFTESGSFLGVMFKSAASELFDGAEMGNIATDWQSLLVPCDLVLYEVVQFIESQRAQGVVF